ncbi:MAG: hypothetical protein ABFD69_04890 [Candidatus Sumerlaeia bacterium]
MAKQPKPNREQLERDEIADGFMQTVEMLHRNRTSIMMGILVLILLIIGIRAYVAHTENVQSQINEAVSLRMGQYEMGDRQADPKARADAYKSLLNDINSDIGKFGTGSQLARELVFLKGLTYYSLDQFPQAQEAYKQYIQQAGGNEERARGQIALAYSYENQSFFPTSGTLTQRGLLDQALAQYQTAKNAANGQNPYLYYYALLGEARINELTGANDKAVALYQQILKDRAAPTPAATPAEEGTDAAQNRFVDMLRQMLNERESQLSFAATAKLRLERLEAKASLAAPAVSTTVTTATTSVAQ